MILKSERKHESLREVLFDKVSIGPSSSYWVFSEIGDKLWENLTVLSPGRYGIEFNKTYGHYHSSSNETEIYKLLSGQGIFLLQKKFLSGTEWIKNKVSEVIFIQAEAGDEIKVPHDFAHSWTNIGTTPLVLLDNWKWGHTEEDYSPIKTLGGMSYYFTAQKNDLKFMVNKMYAYVPTPKWVTAKEFAKDNYLGK
jgi:oxalate decarboxylase/phosphoglucose isomerase-like protein (cupin superfamily)